MAARARQFDRVLGVGKIGQDRLVPPCQLIRGVATVLLRTPAKGNRVFARAPKVSAGQSSVPGVLAATWAKVRAIMPSAWNSGSTKLPQQQFRLPVVRFTKFLTLCIAGADGGVGPIRKTRADFSAELVRQYLRWRSTSGKSAARRPVPMRQKTTTSPSKAKSHLRAKSIEQMRDGDLMRAAHAHSPQLGRPCREFHGIQIRVSLYLCCTASHQLPTFQSP